MIVAIVGRPNVGKSTLFNRLTGSRSAIVDPTSGVTRDRHYGACEWNGKEFTIVDTGGYVSDSEELFDQEIRKQVKVAIDEAAVLIFVVDAMEGITELDEDVAGMLRRTKKPVFLVANKVDTPDKIPYASEFYSFGLGEIYPLSSINGSGTGEFLDAIIKALPEEEVMPDELKDLPKFAVVGRPNVGKSSFLNALTGEERNIVTPIAGTTRDSVHTHFKGFGHDLLLVDTAGLRKKGKVEENLEFYSVMRTIRAIENCDVVLLILDATQGIESQDMNIFRLAEKNTKGIVILINKWDLIEKDNKTLKTYEEEVRRKIAPFSDVPILFISALTKQRVLKALEVAVEVYHNRLQKIPTRKLNDEMLPIFETNPPPAYKGKYIKVKFCTQLPTHAPTFAFFCNLPQYLRDPYKRFVENKMREKFNFTGVPLQIFFRKK